MMIRYKLWKMSRRAQPDVLFVAGLEKTFAKRKAQSAIGAKSVFTLYALRFTSAAVAIVLILGGSTTTYAYASESVLPNSPLYPLREAVEIVEEKVAISPASKAAVQRKLVERRLGEIRKMSKKNLVIEPRVAERLRDPMLRLEATSTAKGVTAIDDWKKLSQRKARAMDKREAERLEKEADEKFTEIEDRLEELKDEADEEQSERLRSD